MTANYKSDLGKFSIRLAIGSLLVGAVLLLLAVYFPKGNNILMMGFVCACIAVFFNLIVLLALTIGIFTTGQFRYYGVRSLILLANIPVAFAYMRILVCAIRSAHQF